MRTTQEIADRVSRELKSQRISQRQVAERIGLSPAQVSRLLSGKSRFRPEQVSAIARMLDRDPEKLRGVEGTSGSYLTVKEAAERSRYHQDTIRKAVYRGEMKSTQRVKGGKYLILESDLTAWLAGGQ